MKIKLTDAHHRYRIPAEVTVQIDTREKYPLLFPESVRIAHPEISYNVIPIAVNVENIKLDFGDYRLKEYPNCCVIERKASGLELFKNLNESEDRIRQAKAFRRLTSSCRYPYLLIEASPAEILSSRPEGSTANPELLIHRLSVAIAKYNLRALFIPWKSRDAAVRRKVGTLLVHLMLGCALNELLDVPPVLLEE